MLWLVIVDMHLMITVFVVYVNVCILLPLDTQRQYDAIMTLESFLTLVSGAGVPHLRGRGETDAHNANMT